MKISQLIARYETLIRKARLARAAHAYATLLHYAQCVQRAGLTGLVRLQQPDADQGRLWASLTALEGRQSVLEEHFCDEDLMELADAAAFVRGIEKMDTTFQIEDLETEFVAPLRRDLEQAGVRLDLVQRSKKRQARQTARTDHPRRH